jgi:hypothetical protein
LVMFEDQSIVKPGMTLPVNNHIDRLQVARLLNLGSS